LTSGYLTCIVVRVPDTLAILKEYVRRFDAEDVDGLAALYAPATDYRQPMAPEPLTTPDAVHAFESGMFAQFHDVAVEVLWAVASEYDVAAGARIAATHNESGTRIAIESAEHLRIDDGGLIVHHQRYMDAADFARQLGVAASM
jgi:hypothetical protein